MHVVAGSNPVASPIMGGLAQLVEHVKYQKNRLVIYLTFYKKYVIIYIQKKKERFMKKLDKRMFKKSSEELQEYMKFKRRGSRIENRKGKGSYTRKQKHKKDENQDYA